MDAQPRRTAASSTGKRQQAREENRRVILDAARRIFAEMGYGASTVRDIIRATPLASGTFYNYFKSKEEVFHALRDETARAIRPQLRAERLRAETVQDFVAGTFRIFFGYIAANRPAQEKPRESVHVRIDTPEITASFKELREDIEAAMARGLLPAVDAELLTAALVGAAFEMGDVLNRRGALDSAEATQFASTLFLSGLHALAQKGHGKDGAANEGAIG